MPYRSRRSFKRPSPRFGARRGRMKQPNAPVRWEVANFRFSAQISTNTGVPVTQTIELLKIAEHTGGSAITNVFLEAATRRIEIGGIVFDHGRKVIGVGGTIGTADRISSAQLLVIDKLDETSAPISLPNWELVQSPVSVNPIVEENQFPTRILWRNGHIYYPGLPATSSIASPAADNVVHVTRTQNLRLRRFLDDQHGLYFHTFCNSVGTHTSFTVHDWFWGTIYYRWVIS